MKIEIRNAELSDSEYLFALANDPETRSNSFNSNSINRSDHINWFSKRLINPYSYTYILSTKTELIGTVKFDKNSETVIGITVDPKFRGLGYGSILIQKGCEEFWKSNDDEISAYIKKENIASVKAFEKASFKIKSECEINGIQCIKLTTNKNEL